MAAGANIVINGRSAKRLDEAVARLKALRSDAPVQAVAADITTAEGVARLVASAGNIDILVNNNAGPTPGDFLSFTEEDWVKAIGANMIAPLMLIRQVLPGMKERNFGRIVNITSAMVTAPRPHMTLSAAARTGLTAACKAISRQYAPYNITINNLLPERFDTPRQQQMAQIAMQQKGISFDQARAEQIGSIPAGRMGQPYEFGAACVFLCSDMAGYISGQNLHLDGAAYPGLV